MANSGDGIDGDATAGISNSTQRNPLTCGVCQDYFNDPCLLTCFHTLCARCIRGPHLDSKVTCPICG